MGMPVHKTGRKGGVTEINDLCIRGRRQIASGIYDFVALNNDDAVLDERL